MSACSSIISRSGTFIVQQEPPIMVRRGWRRPRSNVVNSNLNGFRGRIHEWMDGDAATKRSRDLKTDRFHKHSRSFKSFVFLRICSFRLYVGGRTQLTYLSK